MDHRGMAFSSRVRGLGALLRLPGLVGPRESTKAPNHHQSTQARGPRGAAGVGVGGGRRRQPGGLPLIDAPGFRGLGYRGTSLIRKRHPLGPYSRHMRRTLRGPRGDAFLYERGTPVGG